MTLDDIKNINLNDLSSWPLLIKIVAIGFICIFILVGGYFMFIQGPF
jgi:type IV pilus assembly protein PilO